jgi:hypothetical protein
MTSPSKKPRNEDAVDMDHWDREPIATVHIFSQAVTLHKHKTAGLRGFSDPTQREDCYTVRERKTREKWRCASWAHRCHLRSLRIKQMGLATSRCSSAMTSSWNVRRWHLPQLRVSAACLPFSLPLPTAILASAHHNLHFQVTPSLKIPATLLLSSSLQ